MLKKSIQKLLDSYRMGLLTTEELVYLLEKSVYSTAGSEGEYNSQQD